MRVKGLRLEGNNVCLKCCNKYCTEGIPNHLKDTGPELLLYHLYIINISAQQERVHTSSHKA